MSEPKWLNAQSSICSYPVLLMFMPSSLRVWFFTVKEQKRLQVEAPSVIAYYVLHMCVLYGTTPSRSKRHHCLWINFTATFAAHIHNRSMGFQQLLQWQVCWASHSRCFLILYFSISTAIFSRSKQGFVLSSPVTIYFLLDFTWSVTNAPFVGSACEAGQIMERCSFHLVPHFWGMLIRCYCKLRVQFLGTSWNISYFNSLIALS